jgi:hypothetical protein
VFSGTQGGGGGGGGEEDGRLQRSFSDSALQSLTEEEKEELAAAPLMLDALSSSSSSFIIHRGAAGTSPIRAGGRAAGIFARHKARSWCSHEEDEEEEEEEGDDYYYGECRRKAEQPTLKLSLTPMTPLFGSSLPQLSATTFLFSSHDQLEQLIALFPLHYQNFMRTFLFTQLWTVYTDELDRIFAERRSQISIDQLMLYTPPLSSLPPSFASAANVRGGLVCVAGRRRGEGRGMRMGRRLSTM